MTPAAEAVELATDPVALERILLNLCDNSCRYAADGERLKLSLDVRGSHVVISWRDHGPGLPRRARRRMRGRSRLLGGTPVTAACEGVRSVEGIGLGLSLCRQLARHLGGRLRILSPEEGTGTVVELGLPGHDAGA